MSDIVVDARWIVAFISPLLGGGALFWAKALLARVERLETDAVEAKVVIASLTPRLDNIEVLLADLHRKVDTLAEVRRA